MADEHLASEITLRVLALQRAVRQARRQRRNRRVLLLAPQGERHVIGLNMACPTCSTRQATTRSCSAPTSRFRTSCPRPSGTPDVIAFSATMDETNEVLDAAIDHLRMSKHGAGVVLGGTAVSFEVAATWNAPVCRDVSNVFETVSTRSCSTRRSIEQPLRELLPQPLVTDAHVAEHGAAGEDDPRRARDGHRWSPA